MAWPADSSYGNSYSSSAISTKTATYTATLTDAILLVNAASGAFSLTLPPAASAFTNGVGKIYSIKKTDSSANSITIQANGAETIDGLNTRSLNSQYSTFNIVSDGTKWNILSKI